jgi:hypothetical protein
MAEFLTTFIITVGIGLLILWFVRRKNERREAQLLEWLTEYLEKADQQQASKLQQLLSLYLATKNKVLFKRIEQEQAIWFLKDALSDGSHSADEICQDAERYGISYDLLEWAREQLGVKSLYSESDGVYYWSLPSDKQSEPEPSS